MADLIERAREIARQVQDAHAMRSVCPQETLTGQMYRERNMLEEKILRGLLRFGAECFEEGRLGMTHHKECSCRGCETLVRLRAAAEEA